MRGARAGRWATPAAAVTALGLLLTGCGSDGAAEPARGAGAGQPRAGQPSASPTATPAPPPASTPTGALEAVTDKHFDPANFDNPTRIDNPWYPLTPGKQLRHEGTALVDGEPIERAVSFTVTDLTKVIGGVRTVVVWERDYSDGELVEAELALFAQDNDGNVWHFGQYPEEYEEGKLAAAPAWIHGLQGAKAGIAMRAKPAVRSPDYAQGFGPKVNWTDRARVHQVGARTCVPVACYDDVLVTAEAAADEPNAAQLKYYARGVGNIRVGWTGADEEQETLALTKVRKVGPGGMAVVRAEALKLEKNAYEISKDVYRHTERAR
jgi:hypothetical protein